MNNYIHIQDQLSSLQLASPSIIMAAWKKLRTTEKETQLDISSSQETHPADIADVAQQWLEPRNDSLGELLALQSNPDLKLAITKQDVDGAQAILLEHARKIKKDPTPPGRARGSREEGKWRDDNCRRFLLG